MPAVLTPTTYRHPHGEACTLLQSAAESDGARTILHCVLDAAASGPSLSHRTYAKQYEVLEGTLALYRGSAAWHLGPGDVAVISAGEVHRVANDTLEPAAYLVDVVPGHAGYEWAMKALAGLAADGLVGRRGVPLNPFHLATLLEWAESEMPGASPTAARLLARRARATGVDVALFERYCR